MSDILKLAIAFGCVAVALLIIVIIILILLIKVNNKKNISDNDLNKITSTIALEIIKNQSDINLSTMDKLFLQVENMRKILQETMNYVQKENIEEIQKVNSALITSLEHIENEFKESEIKITKTVSSELLKINESVEQRLINGFQKTQDTFTNIVERLAKIDEAQKNIENLSTNVIKLQDILQDKKIRGNFGEFQLYQILKEVFGETTTIYETQAKLSNGYVVDALIKMPEPINNLSVDSKFPLENFRKLQEENNNTEKKMYESLFRTNLKKHIDDISSKYIIKEETANVAIMFIPSEAIYYYILSNVSEIVRYAQSKNITLASPTTFISLLQVIQITLIDYQRRKNIDTIVYELARLSDEFEKYINRWNVVKKDIDKIHKDANDLDITNKKISKRFGELYERKENTKNYLEEKEQNENE